MEVDTYPCTNCRDGWTGPTLEDPCAECDGDTVVPEPPDLTWTQTDHVVGSPGWGVFGYRCDQTGERVFKATRRGVDREFDDMDDALAWARSR